MKFLRTNINFILLSENMNKISKNDNTSYTCLIFYLDISLFRSRLLVAFWKKILFWKFHVTPWNTPRPPIIFVFQNFCKEADSNCFLWRSSIQHVREIFQNLNFLTPWYAHVRVNITEEKLKVLRKISRTHWMDDLYWNYWQLLLTCFMISGYKTWIKHS